MSIANRLKNYIDGQGVRYDTVEHPRSLTAVASAHNAHVPARHMAKSVVVHHELGYAIVVVPSTYRVELGRVQDELGKRLGLASEEEIGGVFEDCDMGAVPPVGAAYGLEVLVDDSLLHEPEVWFEGGDHRTLVHVDRDGFNRLLRNAKRGQIGHQAHVM